MPHQYGLPGFAQTPPSPPSQALLPRIGGGAVPGSTGGSSTTVYRQQIEEKRLTRDAMERYMRERNDMVIVILHAKVIFQKFGYYNPICNAYNFYIRL